jgi:hypothetical protein
MWMDKAKASVRLAAAVIAAQFAMPLTHANADSYAALQGQGYKTSKLTRGASGSLGWFVIGGGKKFFCPMRVATAQVGKTGLIGFTSSGKQVPMNRKVYEHYAGSASIYPQLSDLQAGRPRPQDVRACIPAR